MHPTLMKMTLVSVLLSPAAVAQESNRRTLANQPESQRASVRKILQLGGDWESPDKTVLIGLIGDKFTSDKFSLLRPLTDVRMLYFQEVPADDHALKHCAAMKHLTQLQIDSCRFSGVGLKHFANSKKLKRLIIDDTPITDDGLATIAKLTSLQSLDICNFEVPSKVSQTGVRQLRALKNLKRLSVAMAEVPDGLEAELQRALPNCDVTLSAESTSSTGGLRHIGGP